MANARNVLLLIADDWSPIAGCYGDPVIRTPNIDAFAATGTKFNHAFCNTPSCAVSRASILSGLYSHQHQQYGHCHGVHGFRTGEQVQTIPSVLRRHGMRSACIGKNHVAPMSVYPYDCQEGGDSWSAADLERRTARFIEASAGKPFFAMVASMLPHRAGEAFGCDRHQDEYDDVTYAPSELPVPDFLPDHPEVRRDLANYYQAVSRYDRFIGRLLKVLDDSGRADQTLVIVMTDHGMPFPGAKASSFDTGHRCPLIVRRPGQRATGITCDAMTNWVDLAPTIYEWMGVPRSDWPAAMTGRSLLEVLETEATRGWDETFFSHCFHEVTNHDPYRVLRERRYKFVRNLAWQMDRPLPTDLFRSPTWQAVRRGHLEMMGRRPTREFVTRRREALYDIQVDPMETNNIIDDPALADVVRRMRERLTDFRRRTRDPWLEVDFQEGTYKGPTFG